MDARMEYIKPEPAVAERLAYDLYTEYTASPTYAHYLSEQWFWMTEAYRAFFRCHLSHATPLRQSTKAQHKR